MQRRQFFASSGLVLGAWAAFNGNVHAATPIENSDYVKLARPVATEAPAGKVEVVDFFWYNCPHCFAFEPAFEAWVQKMPDYVSLRRVPVQFTPAFVPQQKLYYALEAMGKVDDMHTKVFNAIHVEHQSLQTPEGIFAWIGAQGLDKAKFIDLFNSFAVAAKVKAAADLQNAYQVDGVPALGVAGLYYTSSSISGSMARSLDAVDYLVDLQHKA